MSAPSDLLRLNVGFIVHQNVGYSRDFPIEFPEIHLPPDLDLAELNGSVRVTRTAKGLLVRAGLTAVADAECVRCVESYQQKLEIDFTELYAFSANSAITESNLVVPENGKIDLAPIVREEMLLAMPINALCRPDCKGLCPVCGENQNVTTCNHAEQEIDPRLDILKTLLQKGDVQELSD